MSLVDAIQCWLAGGVRFGDSIYSRSDLAQWHEAKLQLKAIEQKFAELAEHARKAGEERDAAKARIAELELLVEDARHFQKVTLRERDEAQAFVRELEASEKLGQSEAILEQNKALWDALYAITVPLKAVDAERRFPEWVNVPGLVSLAEDALNHLSKEKTT